MDYKIKKLQWKSMDQYSFAITVDGTFKIKNNILTLVDTDKPGYDPEVLGEGSVLSMKKLAQSVHGQRVWMTMNKVGGFIEYRA